MRAAGLLATLLLVLENVRYVLIAMFGATAGQGVVWYTGSQDRFEGRAATPPLREPMPSVAHAT
jgi:hypothetical protein